MTEVAQIKYAFRMTHIDNIPQILLRGFVHATSLDADPNYISIGDSSVIKVREQKIVRKDLTIGDYIPFYFGVRSPMLFVIQRGFNGVKQFPPEELVYCVIRIKDIITARIDCLFTDGHALNSITQYYDGRELTRLDEIVRRKDVFASYWVDEYDRDLKRRKEAELLIRDDLPPKFIKGFVVYNENVRDRLMGMGVVADRIVVNREYYF